MPAASRPSALTLDEDSLAQAVAELAERDDVLDSVVVAHGMPPFWRRRPGWRTLVHIILEQQVSLASARACYARLQRGVRPFTAQNLSRCEPAQLRALGVTRQKARYCIGLAAAVADGRFAAQRVVRRNDEQVRATLCSLDGIGVWTADCYLLLALCRPDVWPDGDLALRNVVADRYGVSDAVERGRLSESWRPWRSVAARLLWHDYLSRPRS